MNKVTFRCKRSGNCVSFVNEGDIIGLRKHEGYEEVKDVETPKAIEAKPYQAPPKEVLKVKRKQEVPSFLQE